jgi:RNA polymerase sigma-70 factor, ECF subfamily
MTERSAGITSDTPRDPEHYSRLWQRVIGGDQRALEEIMQAYAPQISRLAQRLLGWQTHESDDVVQEVFIKAYEHRTRFRSESTLGTWLTSITINVCRTLHRRRILSLAALSKVFRKKTKSFDPPSEDLRDLIRAAVRRLPHAYRELVVLYYLEDMPLGITECAANTRLNRARSLLKGPLARLRGTDA